MNKLSRQINKIPKSNSCEVLLNAPLNLKNQMFKTKKNINAKKNDIIMKIYFNNKYYSSNTPIKKGMKLNKLLLKNYDNYNTPRKIESSLIGSKVDIYQRIQKIVRFWGGVCNYSYPKFQLVKLHLQTRNLKVKKEEKKINKSDIIKLPKLYTNSSIITGRNKKISGVKKENNILDILTKTYKDSFF